MQMTPELPTTRRDRTVGQPPQRPRHEIQSRRCARLHRRDPQQGATERRVCPGLVRRGETRSVVTFASVAPKCGCTLTGPARRRDRKCWPSFSRAEMRGDTRQTRNEARPNQGTPPERPPDEVQSRRCAGACSWDPQQGATERNAPHVRDGRLPAGARIRSGHGCRGQRLRPKPLRRGGDSRRRGSAGTASRHP